MRTTIASNNNWMVLKRIILMKLTNVLRNSTVNYTTINPSQQLIDGFLNYVTLPLLSEDKQKQCGATYQFEPEKEFDNQLDFSVSNKFGFGNSFISWICTYIVLRGPQLGLITL